MTPKLSNLDIPEIKAAATEWALASNQIEKITLHRFKPTKPLGTEGPFYAIILWVSPEVDVAITPWEELVNAPDGKAPRAQVREQYKGQDGNIDIEKIEKHPLYDLWKLFDNLSDPIRRGYFDSFYRHGFERTDPRFDWLILLLNEGNENVFDLGEIYEDLDNTEVGSSVLFSRRTGTPQENVIATQTLISVESHVPGMEDNDRVIFPLKLEPLKVYAKWWVKKLREKLPDVSIERISLYHCSIPYSEIRHERHPVKYCIVFDIPGEILPVPEPSDSHIDKIISGDRSIYDLLECYQTIRNQDSYLFLMDAAFPPSIYHDKPDANFKDEWIFLTRRLAEGNRGILSQEPCKVLYSVKEIDKIIEREQHTTQCEQRESDYKNAFICQGDTWEIWHNGKRLNPIINMDGLTYIVNLMLHPGKSIHVTDLCDSVKPPKRDAMMAEDDVTKSLDSQSMSISSMQDDGIDAEGKKALKKKFQDLYEIINEPDSLQCEREEAIAELKRMKNGLNVYGKKPLHHRAPKKVNESVKDDMDRAREAIKRACEKIRKQSPELADYLKNTIRTGTQYSFTDTATPWNISI